MKHKRNPLMRMPFLFLGLFTFIFGLAAFVVGTNFTSRLSFGFGSKYLTLAIILLVVGFLVCRSRKGKCCS